MNLKVEPEHGPVYFELNTGAKIPSVELGTWKAEPGLVGDAVIAAVKAGYIYTDCARVYGNEKEVGAALKQLIFTEVVRRSDLWITSKLWVAIWLGGGLVCIGQARAIGVSTFATKKLQDLLKYAKVPPAVNQVECHPVWQQPGLHNFCKSTSIHLSARLLRGAFAVNETESPYKSVKNFGTVMTGTCTDKMKRKSDLFHAS